MLGVMICVCGVWSADVNDNDVDRSKLAFRSRDENAETWRSIGIL